MGGREAWEVWREGMNEGGNEGEGLKEGGSVGGRRGRSVVGREEGGRAEGRAEGREGGRENMQSYIVLKLSFCKNCQLEGLFYHGFTHFTNLSSIIS